MKTVFFFLLAGLLLFGCTQPADQSAAGANGPLASASVASQGSQAVSVKGSDTELQMFAALAEAFMESDGRADVTVTGGGSGTGIAALINGEIDVADSSRPMKEEEIAQARRNGVEPVAFVIARDGLAVAVHPDNPVAALSLQQVADIYTGKITNWQDVGGTDAAITLYGRQSTSGTYVYFRDTVLKDDYSPNMRNMEGTAAIAEAVSTDVSGIGYVGLGYVTGGIQVVSLDGQSPLDAASVASGDYVLTRPLYQYTDGVPPKDGAIGRMIRFTISLDGQVVVESTGFLPISDAQRAENQAVLSQAS